MNEHILQSYIDNITMHYGVSQEFIFSEGQKREKTEPRQFFFYICNKKGIPITSIQKFMRKFGFDMHNVTIYQGLKRFEEIIEGDRDYTALIEKLMRVTVNV